MAVNIFHPVDRREEAYSTIRSMEGQLRILHDVVFMGGNELTQEGAFKILDREYELLKSLLRDGKEL